MAARPGPDTVGPDTGDGIQCHGLTVYGLTVHGLTVFRCSPCLPLGPAPANAAGDPHWREDSKPR